MFYVNLYVQRDGHITKTTVKFLDVCCTDYVNFEIDEGK